MKIKDLVQGGIYMYHTTTPQACNWYNDVHAKKLVVISTLPYYVHRDYWQQRTSLMDAQYNAWEVHNEKKSYHRKTPKYLLVGCLDWNPYGGTQKGTKIHGFYLVQPRFLRKTWKEFRAESRRRAVERAQREAEAEKEKAMRSQEWAALKVTLEDYYINSDLHARLERAIDIGAWEISLYTEDVQALIEVIDRQ